MTNRIIITTDIPREQGFLYYVATDSKGCLEVHQVELHRGGRKKKVKN